MTNDSITDNTLVPQLYKIEQIHWQSLEQIGITREMLETDRQLEYLLQGRKTTKLFNITIQNNNLELSCQARLQVFQGTESYLNLRIFGIKKQIDLQTDFMGHQFSASDKYNLLTMGNMGRIVSLKDPVSKQIEACIISVDKLTNELTFLAAKEIKIPTRIKGVTINHQQVSELLQGKAVYITKMLSKNNKHFNAHVQYNADKRYIEYIFDNKRLVDQSFVNK